MKFQKQNIRWSHRNQGSSLKVLNGLIQVLVLLEPNECKDDFLCFWLLQHLQVNTPLLLLIINQHLQDKRGDSTKGSEKVTLQHLRWTWCHCLQETKSLQHIPYLDDVVYSSDHLTAEHERFEQLRLTSQLSLNDDPHLWDKPATHNHPTHN